MTPVPAPPGGGNGRQVAPAALLRARRTSPPSPGPRFRPAPSPPARKTTSASRSRATSGRSEVGGAGSASGGKGKGGGRSQVGMERLWLGAREELVGGQEAGRWGSGAVRGPAGRGGAHPGTGPCPRGRAAPRVLCAWAARTSRARSPRPRRPRLRWPPSARTPAAAAAAKTGASEPPAWRPRARCREEPRGAVKPVPGWLRTGPRDSPKDQDGGVIHEQRPPCPRLRESPAKAPASPRSALRPHPSLPGALSPGRQPAPQRPLGSQTPSSAPI